MKNPTNILARLARQAGYYFNGLYERSGSDHVFLMAGGLAFSLFSCVVPFAFVLLAILGRLFSTPEVAGEIFSFIDKVVPYPEQAAAIRSVLAERFDQIASVTDMAGALGLVVLLVASTSLFSSLRTILNVVFRNAHEESILHGKLWDFVLVTAVLVVTVIMMIAIPALDAVLALARDISWLQRLGGSSIGGVVINLVSFLSLVAVFSALYWLVPYRKPKWRKVVVGAVAASVLWLVAKELFGYYVDHAVTLHRIYGVYAFVVLSAFWIYYSALVLIMGAEIAQLYVERQRQISR